MFITVVLSTISISRTLEGAALAVKASKLVQTNSMASFFDFMGFPFSIRVK
jgi:hypothetical protein